MASLIVLGILGYLLLGLVTGVIYEVKVIRNYGLYDDIPSALTGLLWPLTIVLGALYGVCFGAENLINSIADRLTKKSDQ